MVLIYIKKEKLYNAVKKKFNKNIDKYLKKYIEISINGDLSKWTWSVSAV